MSSSNSSNRECGYEINIKDRMETMRTQINSFKSDGLFCDVIMSFGSIDIQAHRLMLATVQYFFAMFTCRMKENLSGVVDMTRSVPQELAYPLMDYIYLGKLKVSTFDQLLELLVVSDKLGFEVYKMSLYYISCSHTPINRI